jgi:hypothetical protein
MTRRQRRESRRVEVSEFRPQLAHTRMEWLGHGLSTESADRPAAEGAVTRLYALLGQPPPEFVWIGSPGAVGTVLEPWVTVLRSFGELPMVSRLANLLSALRQRLDEHLKPFDLSIVDSDVREPLRESLRVAVADRIRAEVNNHHGLYWYGQQEAEWVAYYQACQQVLGIEFDPTDAEQLELWAATARSCGWWWPRDGRCVIAERPLAIRLDGQRRLHHEDGPAIVFPDGWGVHCWHGARVPEWVVTNPTVERITAERNVEVRRCAIEHLGWPTYIERAGLRLLGRAPDPGNPGCELLLYDDKSPLKVRLLLAVNGSVERDGTRRWYGLRVPPWFTDPVEAAGWSYGLTGPQYSRLQRRT